MIKNINRQVKPDWLKIKIQLNKNYRKVNDLVKTLDLNTVCEEARGPNIYECWDAKTATIMILGDVCTRACGFCSVKTGGGGKVDKAEPLNTAIAVKKLGLKHVVITSVDRDDLKNDYGATIWAETIREIRKLAPDVRRQKPKLQNVTYREQKRLTAKNANE